MLSNYLQQQPQPPVPTDPVEATRQAHSRLRRRLLYGLWRDDLWQALRVVLGTTRADAIGEPDLSANPFRAVCQSVAALYDRAPLVRNPDAGPDAESAMTGIVSRAGLYPLMQRQMRDALGMREMLLRVDARPDTDGDAPVEVTYRPVYPDMVVCTPDPERPEEAVVVKEARLRTVPGSTRTVWTWEIWDIADPNNPSHRILSAQADGPLGAAAGVDVSHLYGLPEGGLTGDAYPARKSNGMPILPYVVHHAARTGALWDPYEGIEVVVGTLEVGVKWTLFGHFLRNASWPQRWTLGAEVAGAGLEGLEGRERTAVVTDPATVLQLQAIGGGESTGQAMAGQWAASSDPKSMAEAIGIYERRIASFAGLDPSDIQRVSGDPRSGYANAIGRDGKRESQRRYAPIFAPADVEVLEVTACLVNRALGSEVLPESGWDVQYQSLPPSAEELASQQAYVLALLAAGLVDKPGALMMLDPSLTRDEAVKRAPAS